MTIIRTVSIISLLFSIASSVYAQNATDIIRKSEKAVRGNSMMGVYEITIKTRKWTRTMTMKSWEKRIGKKSFSEITSPARDAGNRFLLTGQQMRQYVPKLQKDIKISPSMMLQSWMGSDFTNDDIVKESSITKDYFHSLNGSEKINKHDCYKIIMKPKPEAAVVWGKIIYFARKSDSLPVREEFYNEHDKLKKVMNMSDFKRMHDRVIPTTYKMETVRKKGRYTLMKIKYAKFNVRIPPRVFTLQNLKRR